MNKDKFGRNISFSDKICEILYSHWAPLIISTRVGKNCYEASDLAVHAARCFHFIALANSAHLLS